jgi:hypothetical protein
MHLSKLKEKKKKKKKKGILEDSSILTYKNASSGMGTQKKNIIEIRTDGI